jgi:hypothetical protein
VEDARDELKKYEDQATSDETLIDEVLLFSCCYKPQPVLEKGCGKPLANLPNASRI